MNLNFAFAVSTQNTIESQHFGDADKFLLFELGEKGWISTGEIINPFKGHHGHHGSQGHEAGHGHGRKADSIIALLKGKGVQVVVSRQFGPNIRRICEHFMPVLVTDSSILAASSKIADRQEEIESEWKGNPGKHNIIRIMKDRVLSIPLKEE
ncbi:MAG: hypothetical protein KDD02_27275 [Phaeodactylibacter sp.]|nr:hypothetical protein [Phaeodactylibacter sp.]MCB9299375.1 hypothetical protein [Lewinellaceae bacterium]